METMNNDQLLELLKSDVNKFNQYREENPQQEIDFSHEDLSGADLSGADLFGADLYGLKIDPDGMKMLMDCIGIVAQNGWIS